MCFLVSYVKLFYKYVRKIIYITIKEISKIMKEYFTEYPCFKGEKDYVSKFSAYIIFFYMFVNMYRNLIWRLLKRGYFMYNKILNLLYCKWKIFNCILKIFNLLIIFEGVQLLLILIKEGCNITGFSLWNHIIFGGAPLFVAGEMICVHRMKNIEKNYEKYVKEGQGIEIKKIKKAENKEKFYFGVNIILGIEILVTVICIQNYRELLIVTIQYQVAGIFLIYFGGEIIYKWRNCYALNKIKKKDYNKIMSNMNDDFVYISSLLERMDNENIKKYVAHQLYTYAEKARFNKRCYYIFSMISLSAPAVALVFNNLSEETNSTKWFVSVLSAVATTATGINGLVKFKETWIRYRSYCEILKREVTEYITGVGDYKAMKNDQEGKQEIFYQKLSKRIIEEENEWKSAKSDK